jgi:hypothetical protein
MPAAPDHAHRPTRLERACARLVTATARFPLLKRVLLHPVIARPGYWVASGGALLWGGILSGAVVRPGRIRRQRGVIVVRRCPRWAFGRGGTTVGAVYLTHDRITPAVLDHEAVHRAQWKRYGLAFIPLYFAAGLAARGNRFEIEAGLHSGGYR